MTSGFEDDSAEQDVAWQLSVTGGHDYTSSTTDDGSASHSDADLIIDWTPTEPAPPAAPPATSDPGSSAPSTPDSGVHDSVPSTGDDGLTALA